MDETILFSTKELEKINQNLNAIKKEKGIDCLLIQWAVIDIDSKTDDGLIEIKDYSNKVNLIKIIEKLYKDSQKREKELTFWRCAIQRHFRHFLTYCIVNDYNVTFKFEHRELSDKEKYVFLCELNDDPLFLKFKEYFETALIFKGEDSAFEEYKYHIRDYYLYFFENKKAKLIRELEEHLEGAIKEIKTYLLDTINSKLATCL